VSSSTITEAAPVAPARRVGPRLLLAALANPASILFVLWMLVFWGFAVTQPAFLTTGNVRNMLNQTSILFVVSIAATMVVLMGSIDLSVGGLLALAGLLLVATNHGLPEWLGLVLVLIASVTLGAIVNGLPIAYLRMNPFIVTLGSGIAFRGLANVLTDGNTYVLNHASISVTLATESLGPIPIPVIVMGVVLGVIYFVLRRTYFGRDVYAIGGNEEAAALAGIPVKRVRLLVFVIMALVVGLATILQAGRLSSVAPTAGVGLEWTAVAAVLLGGTSVFGGRGSVIGTAIAVLLLATIGNGLNVSGVASFWNDVVTGTILILALFLEQLRTRFLVK